METQGTTADGEVISIDTSDTTKALTDQPITLAKETTATDTFTISDLVQAYNTNASTIANYNAGIADCTSKNSDIHDKIAKVVAQWPSISDQLTSLGFTL